MAILYDQLSLISDSRGIVFEPIKHNEFLNKQNAHVVISMPGIVRGNHYHVKGEETVAVMGPALVRFRENNKVIDIEIGHGQAYRFIFPPGVPHAIKNTGIEPNFFVAFNTMVHDPGRPDTERENLLT